MLIDVVVDTNVFQHSYDPRQPMRVAAKSFLNKLLAGKTELCVDEGFDLDPSRNRSRIGHEYRERITPGSQAYAVIVKLGMSGRIVKIGRAVDNRVGKIIRQLIRKKADHVFVKVTCNSQSHAFVSHDFTDFAEAKRTEFRRRLDIYIVTASVAQNQV